jgi:protein-tyrosine phosphatase
VTSDIYWIEHGGVLRLSIAARPRAGDWLEDEVDHWRREGVEVVVSLLEPAEVDELDLAAEQAFCEAYGIEFISFPISDRRVPNDREAALRLCRHLLSDGKAVLIHCRAGIGRSSLMAATTLRLAGMAADQAFDMISNARGLTVPDTEIQRTWVETIGQAGS